MFEEGANACGVRGGSWPRPMMVPGAVGETVMALVSTVSKPVWVVVCLSTLMLFGWLPSARQGFAVFLMAYQRVCVLLLKLRGRTPADESEKRVVTGRAWAEYCDTLKAAGAVMFSPGSPMDAQTQAEGYRYLSRLARVSLEAFVECADVCAPRLCALANGSRDAPVKLGSDNPDNLYQNAQLSSKYVYEVSGKRGTVAYLGFGLQAGVYGSAGGLQTVDYKESDELGCRTTNGHVKFLVCCSSRIPPGYRGVCMHMLPAPEQHQIIVRQTFMDRTREVPADLTVVRIDGGGEASNIPAPLTPAILEKGLRTAGLFVVGASGMFSVWARQFKKHVNQLPLFDQQKSNKAGGDPHIRYYHSYWSLEPGEALIIEATPPLCRTWNFQLNNHWMESLDYRYYNIHVNKATAKYQKDGSVCVCVSASRPVRSDVNWIDTVGHQFGTMCWRWVWPDAASEPVATPRTSVVQLAEWDAQPT